MHVPALVVTRPRRDPGELDLEGGQPVGHGGADATDPDDEHPSVGQRGPLAVAPPPLFAVPHRVVDATQGRQHEADRELGGAGVVDTGGGGQRQVLRHPLGKPVVAGRQRLHQGQPRQLRELLQGAGRRHVRQHDGPHPVEVSTQSLVGQGVDVPDGRRPPVEPGTEVVRPVGVGQGHDGGGSVVRSWAHPAILTVCRRLCR